MSDIASTAFARTVHAQPLTAESWAPFGWIPVTDTDPAAMLDTQFLPTR